MDERRIQLEEFVASVNHPVFSFRQLFPLKVGMNLADLRNASRDMGAEGFMLKRKTLFTRLEENVVTGGNGKSIRWLLMQ